jgi:hypothetical protein
LLTTSRLTSAGSSGDEAHDIKIEGKAVELPKFGPIGQLRIDVTIDISRISFRTTASGHSASLDFQIFCGDEKQKVVGERSQRLDIVADDETYRRYLSQGMPFSTRVPVTGVVKYVKMAAYDYGSDLIGTLTLTIKK